MNIPQKIIKYGLNSLGLIWLLFITDLSYAINTGSPNCTQAFDIIIYHIPKLAGTFYFPFLVFCLGLNYLIEKFAEKKKAPREYVLIFAIQFLLILAIAFFVSWIYYSEHCH